MHALDWLRDAGAQPIRPVYAVFGDDSYFIREVEHAIARSVFPGEENDAAISRFAGTQAALADVLDELFTLPFFSRRRLVIVEEADSFVSQHRKDLEAYVEAPSTSAVLLVQTKQWLGTTRLAKLVDRLGAAVECTALRERERGKLVGWLRQHARDRCDAQLDAGAANLLVDLVGLEVGVLVAELEKLAVYAGDTRRIDRADVARLVEAGRVETIWKILDTATTGQGATALKLLDDLVASGESPFGLLAPITASLLKVYHAGQLRAARLDLREACRLAGIVNWAVEKTGDQHAHLGFRRVDRLPATLLRADLDLKGGSALDPHLILELLLVGLALPRTD